MEENATLEWNKEYKCYYYTLEDEMKIIVPEEDFVDGVTEYLLEEYEVTPKQATKDQKSMANDAMLNPYNWGPDYWYRDSKTGRLSQN